MCDLSVVIPAYNEVLMLPRTLRWVQRSIRAHDVSAEVIVSDDGSTDGTCERAHAMGARLVINKARNIAAARNAGAAAARGEAIVFLDADTLLPARTLATVTAALRAGAKCGSSSDVRFYGGRRSVSLVARKAWYRLLSDLGIASGCFMFVTRRLFYEVGGFDEDYLVGEDIAFSLRLRRKTDFILLPRPVYASARKTVLYGSLEEAMDIFRIMLAGRRGLRDRRLLGRWYRRKSQPPLNTQQTARSRSCALPQCVKRHAGRERVKSGVPFPQQEEIFSPYWPS